MTIILYVHIIADGMVQADIRLQILLKMHYIEIMIIISIMKVEVVVAKRFYFLNQVTMYRWDIEL